MTIESQPAPFTVTTAKGPRSRYWAIMGLLIVVLPTINDFVDHSHLLAFHIGLGVFWLLFGLGIAFMPRRTVATLDANGVTLRKLGTLKWTDVDRIEIGRTHWFARVARWLYGTDRVLLFIPTEGATSNPVISRRMRSVKRQLGSYFVIPDFTSAQSLEEIAERAFAFSGRAVTYAGVVDRKDEPA